MNYKKIVDGQRVFLKKEPNFADYKFSFYKWKTQV